MTVRFCPGCGASLEPGQHRCPSCGSSLETWRQDLLDLETNPDGVAEDDATDPTQGEAGDSEATGADDSLDTASSLAEDAPADEGAPSGEADNVGPEGSEQEDPPATEALEAEAADSAATAEEESPEATGTTSGEHAEAKDGKPGAILSPLPMSVSRPDRHVTDDWSHDRRIFVALAAIAVVVLVVVEIAMGSCRVDFNDPQANRIVPGGYREKEQEEGSQGNASADEAVNDNEQPQTEESPEEMAAHQAVKQLYDALPSLDGQVSASEQAFEDNYLGERSTREGQAQAAKELAANVQAACDAAAATTVDGGSAYHSQYLLVMQCYQDLSERMAIVNQLWERDLWYNYPQYYVEIIRKPKYDNTADGATDVAPKLDYATTYAQIAIS